jgi:hypothetical protein
MARFAVSLPLIVLLASFTSAQNPPKSDPQVLSLARRAMLALTGNTIVNDVTLSGDAIWKAGPDSESGTATAYGKTNVDSRIDLVVGSEKRSELRNSAKGLPQGAWINDDGKSTASAMHNCWTDAVWFFPELISLSAVSNDNFRNSQTQLVLTYIGLETRNDQPVQHIQSYQVVTNETPRQAAFTKNISTVNYYLDAQTLIPLSITFGAHPDNAASVNIAVEIDFSDYKQVDGILVPFHITKRLQGNLLLDFKVKSVAVNTGLPDSLFATH